MFEQVNYKAPAARSGDPGAVRELVEALFAEPPMGQFDQNKTAVLKERIVSAELKAQTVSEKQIVDAFNWLMNELSAPPFAQTSERQIKSLSFISRYFMPELFVDEAGANAEQDGVEGQSSGALTPVRAAALIILMLHQKVLNRNYQKEPAEWELDFPQGPVPDSVEQKGETTSRLGSRPASPERIEMGRIIFETYYSPAEQEKMMHGVPDRLGLMFVPERGL